MRHRKNISFRKWFRPLIRAGSCLGVILVFSTVLPGDEPPVADDASLNTLIDSLSSPSRQERHRAETSLIELGESALEKIEATRQQATGTSRDVLLRIQQAIETKLAQKSLQGTQITFDDAIHSWTLKQALAVISSQSHQQIELLDDEPTEELPLKLSEEQILFWTALNAVCQVADVGWRWRIDEKSRVKTIEVSRTIRSLPGASVASGCFRVNAAAVSRRRSFTDANSGKTVRIAFRLDSESGVHPYFAVVKDSDLSLTTQEEGLLRPFSPDANRVIPFGDQTTRWTIDFLRDPSRRLSSGTLRGQVQVRVAARQEEVKFPLTEDGETLRYVGQTQLLMRPPNLTKDGWKVTLQVTYPPGVTWESHQVEKLHRGTWLLSPDGKRIGFESMELVSGTDRTHEILFRFPDNNSAMLSTQLVYLAPALITTADVPFEIELSSLGD